MRAAGGTFRADATLVLWRMVPDEEPQAATESAALESMEPALAAGR